MVSVTASQNVSKPAQGNDIGFVSLPSSTIILFLHLFVLAKHDILQSMSLSAVLKGQLNH